MTQFAKKLGCIVILLVAFYADAQPEVAKATLKAAFIKQFSVHIDWPNAPSPRRIAFIGNDDDYFQSLQQMVSVNRQFSLIKLTKLEQTLTEPMHILVVAKSHNDYLSQLNALLRNKAVLIVSEDVSEHNLIGINFFETPEKTLSFNLNRYNLLYQGLTLKKDIVLLGGSEIDVAEMINEMSSRLAESSDLIKKLNQHVALQNKTIVSNQQQITNKTAELNAISKTLVTAKKEHAESLAKLSDDLKQATAQLTEQTELLTEKQRDVQKAQEKLNIANNEHYSLVNQILLNQEKINSQTNTLSQLESTLEANQAALTSKEQQIKTTAKVLIAIITVLIVFIGLAISLWRLSTNMKRLNNLLASKNEELEQVNARLVSTQKQLVESEKMASLAGLVAGVAHEVNTPLGTAITANTHLSSITNDLYADFKQKRLSQEMFEHIVGQQIEATNLVFRNLYKAAELIKSFKQISADQVSEAAREFELAEYIEELTLSLQHELKLANVSLTVNAEHKINVTTYPGVLSQVVTSLVINSITHAFKSQDTRKINIALATKENDTLIDYFDNGCGVEKADQPRIFEPFFTTNRNDGSTGLGLSICYNLVTQKLKGSITFIPSEKGAHFQIRFPGNINNLIN